ncbi:MAG: DivIVA domain-containing protein [Arcanobacterium sp.]|nr:DivIVA domain-containing protein [Arcanobacterium sp.]
MVDMFKRVGILRYGYHRKDVESFFEKAKQAYANGEAAVNLDENTVRAAGFRWVRNGYEPRSVDAALDRLEMAFIQRRRAKVMTSVGEEAWLEATYEQASSLYPRMLRPLGSRFADAEGIGYAKTEVDEFVNKIAAYFDGKTQLTAKEIRSATFPRAKGDKAYSEAVVDAYLDRAVSILVAVE